MYSVRPLFFSLLVAALGAGFGPAVGTAEASPVLFCKDGAGADPPNAAIDLINDGCISGTASGYPGGGDGIFSNAGGGDPLSAVEAAILGATGVNVNLIALGKSDEGAPFTYTPTGAIDLESSFAGTWTQTSGAGTVRYISIVAANSFALYEFSPGASTGVYSTAGILNNGGQQPTVSHISFWSTTDPGGPVIPEPSTFLLLGSGAVGLLWLRRRKQG